jgi:hypothetical protein
MLEEWKNYKETDSYKAKQAQKHNSEYTSGSKKLTDKQIQNILKKYNLSSTTPTSINELVQHCITQKWTVDEVRVKLEKLGINVPPSITALDDLYVLYAVAFDTKAPDWNTLIQKLQDVDTTGLPRGK